jgi:hypothetical protein
VNENIGPASRWIHYGMTSSDVLDTGLALAMVQSGRIIVEGQKALTQALKKRALEHRDTLCLGRTHGVHAEPTTFGLRLAGFASAQDEYSLLKRGAEKDLIPALQHYGMGLLPYFPLANGALTGKYKRNAPMPDGARLTKLPERADQIFSDANWTKIEALTDFCQARGRTPVELAFSWLAAQPVYSPDRVQRIKSDLATRTAGMTSYELEYMLDGLDEKINILESAEATDAREWVGRYLSVMADDRRAKLWPPCRMC